MIYLMKILNHKNILQLYEIIETKSHAFLIYQYFNGMKLSDYIIKKKKLTEDESLKIFKEILSALAYLKEMYLCNLNINSHNILIDSKNHIKICDFKFGHFYSPKEKSRANFIGDHFSSCPELHSKRPYNPESADIWSTGILLYQMLTGSLPFKSQKDLELIRLIIRGDYSMPNSLSVNMKTLIKGLLETKEEKRFKLNDIFNKRFKLNDIFNQQIIKEKKITKASLLQGLNILTTKYPIDEIAINIFKNNLNVEEEILRKNLENNKFNEITSLFKQIISKLTTKGIQNINDLSSNKFIAYIKDNKNFLKEEEQINNIQNYLKKEEEVKKQSEDIAAILLNNENEILKGLQDLKRQYDRAKKGIRPLKRNRSFGHTKNKKKKLFEFEEDKKNNDKNDNNIEKPKIKAVKRNTAIYQDVGQFYLNKENKEEKKNENISEKPEVKVEEGKENNDIKTQETKNEDNKITKEEKKEEQKPIEQNTKKVEKKLPEKEATIPKKVVPEKKMNFKDQLNAVKLSKIPMKNQIEQKAQKMMMNKAQNAPNLNNKKSAEINNNKKGMVNFKKEDLEKEMNMLKAKKDLKSTSAKLNNDNKKETKPQPQKKNEPKVGGMKNIKEMIEQNLKRQRIMSSDNTKK